MLQGDRLLSRLDQLRGRSRSELVRACGYATRSEDGREHLHFTDFYEAVLEAKGVHVQFRASLEQDFAAMDEFRPDLVIGTTPVVQKAKQNATPALYFTNLISARPLMGIAGAGSLAKVINTALGNQARFDEMNDFFAGVGAGFAAGVWPDMPRERPAVRKKPRKTTPLEPTEAVGAC